MRENDDGPPSFDEREIRRDPGELIFVEEADVSVPEPEDVVQNDVVGSPDVEGIAGRAEELLELPRATKRAPRRIEVVVSDYLKKRHARRRDRGPIAGKQLEGIVDEIATGHAEAHVLALACESRDFRHRFVELVGLGRRLNLGVSENEKPVTRRGLPRLQLEARRRLGAVLKLDGLIDAGEPRRVSRNSITVGHGDGNETGPPVAQKLEIAVLVRRHGGQTIGHRGALDPLCLRRHPTADASRPGSEQRQSESENTGCFQKITAASHVFDGPIAPSRHRLARNRSSAIDGIRTERIVGLPVAWPILGAKMAGFTVGVIQDFVARHFLTGGDFGPEGELHSHHYRVEVTVTGDELDGHGFLVDIVRLREELTSIVERYRDRTLNELPELAGENPGVEVVARAMARPLAATFRGRGLKALTVKLWENESAWASHRIELETS